MAECADTTTRLANPPKPTEASTRSPTVTLLTSGPTATTWPATSLPGTKGREGLIWYCPATKRPSTKFTPAASTATTTCPGPGSGSGRSSTRSTDGGPNSWQTAAGTARDANGWPGGDSWVLGLEARRVPGLDAGSLRRIHSSGSQKGPQRALSFRS